MSESKRVDLKIYVWGNTTDDLTIAIDEAKGLIGEGFTSGFDKNETGGYRFHMTGEDHE